MNEQAISAYETRYSRRWNDAPSHCKAMWMDAWSSAIDQAIGALETHHVSVGNSAAGELAAEWTMANLRDVRDGLVLRRPDGNRDS